MAEIRVPVTAPGATQAANELRGVAGAASNVGKAEEQAAKGVDKLAKAHAAASKVTTTRTNVVLAQSRALAAAAKAEEAAAKASGKGVATIGRGIGGLGGGLLSRVGGTLGVGGALGPLAAAAGVAAFGLTKLAEASAIAVERATEVARAQLAIGKLVEDARKAFGNNALSSFKSNEQTARQLMVGGVNGDTVKKLGGMGFSDAPQALASLLTFQNNDRRAVALQTAMVLKNMGETGGLMEGLGKLSEDRVANAMASPGDPAARLIREITGDRRGGRMLTDGQISDMLDRTNPVIAGTKLVGTAGNLQGNANAVGAAAMAQFGLASDPAAARAATDEMAATLDPIAKAMADYNKNVSDNLAVMQKAADAQYALVKWLQEHFTLKGSLQDQVNSATIDAAVARMPGSTP